MAWAYDRETEADYRAADQGVRFWFDDKEEGRRVALVIGNPALQRLGGHGDSARMLEIFEAHEARIIAGAVALLHRNAAPPIPEPLRLDFDDLPPA